MAYEVETIRYIIDSLWILLLAYWILKVFGNKRDKLKMSFWLHGTWPRRTLSTNWSAQVVVKEDHELITTGPYAIVRHPIYTGFITTMLGTMIAINISILIIITEALVILYLWWKLKREEKIILEQFPREYSEYKKNVSKALIPYLL